MFRTTTFLAVLFLAILLVSVGLSSCGLKPSKDDSVGVRNWLIVPVFYATNRQYIGKDGSIEYSGDPNNGDPLFGVKNIAVPAPPPLAPTPDQCKKMSWQAVLQPENKTGQAPSVNPESCPLKDHLIQADEIANEFHSYRTASGAQDGIIFVHGCCADFESSMKRAGKISAHMGTPVVLYDWVSPVGFSKYLQNETRVDQTIDDFCRFLNNVEKVADTSSISLLGHSMGAAFVDQAMVRRAVKNSVTPLKPFREIIMSNADIDAKAFIEHAQDFAGNGSKVRVYVSKDDDRLQTSAFAHGRFDRLGAPGKLVDELAKSKGLTVIDITALDTGHEIPFSVVAAMHANDGTSPDQGFTLERNEQGYFVAAPAAASRNSNR